MKRAQGALYCRCGNEKLLANGMCATCYPLKRQDDEYFGGFARGCLSGTATAAGCAGHQAGESARLRCIIAYRAGRSSI